MTRLYGRSMGGERCNDDVPGGHWKSLTLLGAMRAEGVVREASLLVDGAMTGELFVKWVSEFLAPTLRPGDVVVMDNLSSHKAAGVEAAIEAVGASVWYLPPYSPDLNPIEKMWSKVKAWLRRVAARSVADVFAAVADALNAVTGDECVNYLLSCGYEK